MASRFLIRVYGDSLGMPRVSEGVTYVDTYAELLAKQWKASLPGTSVYLYNRSFSGGTAPAVYETYRSDSFYFGKPGGDVMIVQCGIVDCALRPLPPRMRRLVERMPHGIRDRIVRFLHQNRAHILNLALWWRVTSPTVYRESMSQTLALAADEFARIYVINIAPTTPETERHSPGLSESIQLYNRLLEEAVDSVASGSLRLVDLHRAVLGRSDGIEECISTMDGHHLTPAGHRLCKDLIAAHEREHGLTPPAASG